MSLRPCEQEIYAYEMHAAWAMRRNIQEKVNSLKESSPTESRSRTIPVVVGSEATPRGGGDEVSRGARRSPDGADP